MRRLSTFKSITWFAKPKVVVAVNCARRGWVNVEMDVIACKACGARILFSAPSSWTQQQVEKAALVFCLKLDNGHKLLCLWLDNACDENLAQFPPTRLPVLVDQFKEHCSLLVQLQALPVISSSAVQSMRTPRLEQFLQLSLPLEMCNSSLLADEKATPSNNRYDEAIKLISLFGWEPLALPYMVVGKDANVCGSPRSPSEKEEEVVILNFSNIELDKGMISDASPNGRNSDKRNVISGSSSGYPTSKETVSNINLIIAGSPLLTNQNPKATISLPMIGRNIRARFSSVSNLRNHLGIDADSRFKSAALSDDGVETTEDAPGSSSENQPSSLNTEIAEIEDHLVTGNNNSNPLEGLNGCRPGTCVVESSNGSTESDALVVRSNGLVNECADEAGIVGFDASSQNEDIHKDEPAVIGVSDRIKEKSASLVVQVCNLEVLSSSEEASIADNGVLGEGERCAEIQEPSAHKDALEEEMAGHRKQLSEDISEEGVMHFDPVRQHRPFCPWIASSGRGAPGWQRTLSSLLHQEEDSDSMLMRSPSASFLRVPDTALARRY